MATHTVYKPKRTGPLTRFRGLHGFQHLDKIGNENSPLALFLLPFATKDVVYDCNDFTEDTINLDYWAINTGSGATNFAILTGVTGGQIRGNTGTTDNSACSLIGPAIWKGDHGCTMEIRWQVNAITSLYFELGFVDVVTDTSLPVTGDLGTPAIASNGSGDTALLVMDTDDTPATAGLFTDGTTTNMNSTLTVNFGRPGGVSTWTPVAGVWNTTRISIQGDAASVFTEAETNGSNGISYYWAGHGDATANRTEGGSLVAPWIFFGTRNTTAKLAYVDYVRVWQNRIARAVTETIP